MYTTKDSLPWSAYMYKVMRIDDKKACLFDSEIMQPTFLSLKLCIEQLHQRSVNYQISTLTNIMYFHEYWFAKFGCTLDYSMYKGEFSGLVITKIISELDGFWLYLGNSRIYASNVAALPLNGQKDLFQSIQTQVLRYQTVCRFISWLIDSYITPHFITECIDDIHSHKKALHSYLNVEAKKYSKYHSNQKKSTNVYKSLTQEQLRDFASLFALPSRIEKDRDGRVTPSIYVSFRNLILVKLLVQYGLRIGEALLLRETSFKPNKAETSFYMLVANLDDGTDPRKTKPLIKTKQSTRELKISPKDYYNIQSLMAQVRLRTTHNFLFTSSIGECPPLSYKAAYKIITDASDAMKEKFPEHFDSIYAEFLENVHPHMLRHTWAYLKLKELYRKHEVIFINAGAANAKGIMSAAKDSLRELGGWSENSMMPSYYAKRFIAEKANEINMKMFSDSTYLALENIEFTAI
ncbi:hypothetical protein CF140_12130 [Aeromonas sobria]|nr:hypothetical protein CF140_12130 [Aeromonas sobria]